MNLHHLSIFLAIAECGSITAASKRQHISQPALSRELKVFEERMGVRLFERLPKGMRLTEAGEVLRDYATRLFELERAAETAMHEVAGAHRGRLAIGASNTIGTYVLPPLLARFRRVRPNVQVSLFVGNTEQVSGGVADLRFSLGFIEGPLHVRGLRDVTFQDDEIIPVTAANDPLLQRERLRLSDLADQPLLMRERGSGTRELIADLLETHDIADGNIMEFSNTEALKLAAVHGGGIAWLPRISVRRELDTGRLAALPLKRLRILRPLKILQRDGAQLPPAARVLVDLLDPALAERL